MLRLALRPRRYDGAVPLLRPALVILALCATSCVGSELAPSVWPPEDFSLVVDELREAGGGARVIRRLSVEADGVVIYGTSSQPLLDDEAGASLPVFERLCIYRLEPASVRSLARGLGRFGSGSLAASPSSAREGVSISVSWRAFDERRSLTSAGRLRGAMGDVVALVASYLPPGEAFDTRMTRPVVPVLRGVPAPSVDAPGALAALRERLAQRPDDPGLLLDAFALACRLGDRLEAAGLLRRWRGAAAERASAPEAGADVGAELDRQAAAFGRMLPREG